MTDLPLNATDVPQPVNKLICTTCNIEWSKHQKLYDQRVRKYNLNVKISYYYDDKPEFPHDIDYRDCVALLLIANQGPMGPEGAMGAMGIQGPKGDTTEWDPRLTPGWESKG